MHVRNPNGHAMLQIFGYSYVGQNTFPIRRWMPGATLSLVNESKTEEKTSKKMKASLKVTKRHDLCWLDYVLRDVCYCDTDPSYPVPLQTLR